MGVLEREEERRKEECVTVRRLSGDNASLRIKQLEGISIVEDQEKTTSWYQQNAFEVLLEFQRVCEELGLRYYLHGGTLLGAIRHKGFIPWDDDIDVAMPREDYDKLAKAGPKYFSEGYFYQDYHTEPNFPHYFSRLRKRGAAVDTILMATIKMEHGWFIDIFPLDPCPDGDKAATRFFQGMNFFRYAILARVSTEFAYPCNKHYVRFLLFNVLKRFPNRWLFFLRECFRKTMGRFSTGNRLCTVGGAYDYPREAYRAEWWREVVPVQFEGHTFPAPDGWDTYLRSVYGDYMILPPQEERKGHDVMMVE